MGVITEYVVSGDMISKRHRKRMQKIISNLRYHYIICGAGRSGFYMMQELKATLRPFVVIEKSEERIREILTEFDDLLYVQGNATNDEIMEQAGLEHATEFLDEMMNHKNTRSEMAEIVMSKEFSFCGLSLNEAALPKKYGILIMVIKKRAERVYTYNPSGNSLIEHADTIVVLGTRDHIYELTKTG